MKKLLIYSLLLVAMVSCDRYVSLEKLPEALSKAAPGDTIILKPGVYEGLELELKGSGTADAPVVVIPTTPGSVTLKGSTSVRISGEGLELKQLLFRNAVPASGESIVEFRNGREYASYCRLSECVFDSCNPSKRDIKTGMVHLYGRHNRVDHNSFLGRLNLGVTIVVRLTDNGCDENFHEIEYNYFGPRPVYGSNGAETIQVGLAGQCLQSCRTHLHDNFFDRVSGEVECVSIKSSDNIVERNAFYECQGVLALRHGDRNLARDNVFVGNGVVNTGGIRVVGEDQQIENNRFYGIRGTRFFAPLALMCGVPNSQPSRYMQVKRTVIRGNVWSDCSPLEFDTGLDLERTLLPEGTVFEDNLVTSGAVPPSYESLREGKGAPWYEISCPEADKKVIVLRDSTYVFEEPLRVDSPTEIIAEEGARPVIRYAGKSSGSIISICSGGSLILRGITFDGTKTPGFASPNAAVKTDREVITPYSLVIEDCNFRKIGSIGNHPVSGTKGTMADSVVIRRSKFSASAGGAISYAGEKDDIGRYNCEYMLLEDCTFEGIAEVAVDLYRGGCDESTAGPRLVVRGCSFDNCSNKVRSAAVRAVGVQDLLIENTSFTHTGLGGYSIKLDEAPWEKILIRNCTFTESGRISRTFN